MQLGLQFAGEREERRLAVAAEVAVLTNLPPLNSPTYLTPLANVKVPCPFFLSSLYWPTYFAPIGERVVPCPLNLLFLYSPTYLSPSGKVCVP